jgi:hypothetical protein
MNLLTSPPISTLVFLGSFSTAARETINEIILLSYLQLECFLLPVK